MSMDQLMALVPIEAATCLSTTSLKGRRSRWERATVSVRGKTRFGPKEDKPYNPPPFVDLPSGLTPLQMDQFLREQRLEELSLRLEKGELEFGDPDIRAPSPPPAYDKNGNRTNTRDIRVRTAMISEHQRLLEYMAKNVPGFVPPNDFKPVKKVRRIIIPQEKYPEYNFMGLIIGPRGCNHKRLESESGAQISIRGRGTQKEGKKTDHQTEEEASMPQHIHIAADTEESLDKAVALIEPLLNPFHPAHEEFKKKGLEQLALVNGVSLVRADTRCSVCGAVGHLSWECPDADFQSFQKAVVKCALCGDKGHVTMDCKLAKGMTSEQLAEVEKKVSGAGGIPAPTPPPSRPVDPVQLDMEYSQLMSELSVGNKDHPHGVGGRRFGGRDHDPRQPFAPRFVPQRPIPPPPPAMHAETHPSLEAVASLPVVVTPPALGPPVVTGGGGVPVQQQQSLPGSSGPAPPPPPPPLPLDRGASALSVPTASGPLEGGAYSNAAVSSDAGSADVATGETSHQSQPPVPGWGMSNPQGVGAMPSAGYGGAGGVYGQPAQDYYFPHSGMAMSPEQQQYMAAAQYAAQMSHYPQYYQMAQMSQMFGMFPDMMSSMYGYMAASAGTQLVMPGGGGRGNTGAAFTGPTGATGSLPSASPTAGGASTVHGSALSGSASGGAAITPSFNGNGSFVPPVFPNRPTDLSSKTGVTGHLPLAGVGFLTNPAPPTEEPAPPPPDEEAPPAPDGKPAKP